MDPNAALAAIREINSSLTDGAGLLTEGEAVATLDRLSELTEGLDEWISRGGFLPDAWQPKSTLREQTWACCTSSIGPTCEHKSRDRAVLVVQITDRKHNVKSETRQDISRDGLTDAEMAAQDDAWNRNLLFWTRNVTGNIVTLVFQE